MLVSNATLTWNLEIVLVCAWALTLDELNIPSLWLQFRLVEIRILLYQSFLIFDIFVDLVVDVS